VLSDADIVANLLVLSDEHDEPLSGVLREAATRLDRRWIPVVERLPDSAGSFLVCTRDGVAEALFLVDRMDVYWTVPDYGDVAPTHWMPLPEPPKDGNA